MNEPEGIVAAGRTDPNRCFDTMALAGSGAGWGNAFIPMQRLLRFINRHISAIKRADPKVIVTVGSWHERSQTDQFGYQDYYTDNCLVAAGGMSDGTMDLYQMHTWAWQGQYSASSPVNQANSAYRLNKPNVLGELSQSGGDGRDITVMFDWAYNQGYSGVWSWQANGGGEGADSFINQVRGLQHIRNYNDPSRGGRVAISLQ